jgi:aconitate hydratase
MVAIESTPDMAAKVYATMRQNLTVVRRRLQKPLTLADKALLGHLDAPEAQPLEPGRSYLALRPDRVVFQDVLGQSGMLQFMQTKRERIAVPATIHCDHLIQARTNGEADLRASLDESKRFTTSSARPRRNTAADSGSRAPGSSIRWCSKIMPFQAH